MNSRNTRTRFNKLTLKKNKMTVTADHSAPSSPDLVVLDDSLDCVKSGLNIKHLKISEVKTYSPIVIDDSAELSSEASHRVSLTELSLTETAPSRSGNASFNNSRVDASLAKGQRTPSAAGWSPAQRFVTATPRLAPAPAAPRHAAREAREECSLKKIEKSHKKLLSELYGEVWKTIPTLFKPKDTGSIDAVTKKLDFNGDDDSDKENDIRAHIAANRDLYLTGSDAKRKMAAGSDVERKSKKKLYTERVAATPEPRVRLQKKAATTTKKIKGKSVTELVAIMKDKFVVEEERERRAVSAGKEERRRVSPIKEERRVSPVKKENRRVSPVKKGMKRFSPVIEVPVERQTVSPVKEVSVERLSFVASLSDNVPSWRCHPEALQYRVAYRATRARLVRRLLAEFNATVFDGGLDADLPVAWDAKLRTTAGTTTNRLIKSGESRIRTSSIKLSEKVVDGPARLRDTLLHELCHAATWLLDGALRAGHGPLWQRWAARAMRRHPALGAVTRCHDLDVHHKYTYKCTRCGYTVKRHSKSLDVTKKCCGYCRGVFQLIVNRKNKDGVVVSTPARRGEVNDFAKYVKTHYGSLKQAGRTHAEVMRMLGDRYRAGGKQERS